MARQWRIEYSGALYHVLSRGNERRNIVFDDEDRASFLKILGEMCERFDIEMYVFVLMDNHYHLLLKTKRPNLSKSMQWFGVSYTRRFNVRHGRSGHLFQGRFKAFLIENNAYLLRLSYYIHRNPLRAGIVHRLIDYQWSSYPFYAYGKKPPQWLNIDPILSQFRVKDKNKAYREEVQRYAKEKKSIWEEVKHGLFMGSKEFIERIRSEYLMDNPHTEIPQQRQVLKGKDLKEIFDRVVSVLGCDVQVLKSSRVKGKDKENRDLLIYFLWKMGLYTNKEIGNLLEITYSAVSRRTKEAEIKLAKDKKFKEQYQHLLSQIKI